MHPTNPDFRRRHTARDGCLRVGRIGDAGVGRAAPPRPRVAAAAADARRETARRRGLREMRFVFL